MIALTSCKKPIVAPENYKTAKRDFQWTIDSLEYDVPGRLPPEQVSIFTIWGSSSKDVFAVGHSDIPSGRLWRYDGRKWTPDKKWNISGFDPNGIDYIVYPYAVSGFDAQNVFVACNRYYEDHPDSAMIIKWNGSAWSEVPWINGKRVSGGASWIVTQNNLRFWSPSFLGIIIKYENGFLSPEPQFTDFRIFGSYIAALENGEVYVNARKDSMNNDNLLGSITKLFKRDITGQWSLIEDKFISGSYEDGYGLGLGLFCIGNRLFTTNRGIWEKIGNNWRLVLSLWQYGGDCFISENNIWFYFRHQVWHWNGKDWAQIDIPILKNYPGSFLYGRGWSDGDEIFLSLHHNSMTYIVHGK
ncbi:MAG TPA: hypothetical protein PLU49_11325 [Saprospiraceae bacterium]|nr:hypothetical protein [Saprospiraceae bacterium]